MLTAAAGILLAITGPSLAAQRSQRASDAYASGTADRSGAYYYGPQDSRAYQSGPSYYGQSSNDDGKTHPNNGRNLPYPDRPYGDPDSW